MGKRSKQAGLVAAVIALVVAASVGASSARSTNKASAPAIHRGGTITALAGIGYSGAWPAGLDPATNTNGGADQDYMTSIFGQLFELREGGKIVPDLATSYKFSKDAKTITMHLRKGVKFSDGTPLNADAYIWNVKRDLASGCTCSPTTLPWDKANPITKIDNLTVAFHLTQPNAAFIHSILVSNIAWPASPTALNKMGEDAFKLKPVGAGPFTVVSDTLSNQLVLARNPNYWKKGRPYLDRLIFKSFSGGDQAALETMQAGQGQVYEGLSVPDLFPAFQKKFVVTKQNPTSPYDIQLNTSIPPFNDIRAREAIYYATDTDSINQHLFHGLFATTQGFTGPGGLFYQPKVPGYRTYNLAKAKALVQQLGGLTVDLGTINILTANQTITALQTMWQDAGMKVTIHSYDLLPLIQAFTGGKWQAMLQTVGAWDPASGVGVSFRFDSHSPFSGVHDPKLDGMLNAAVATLKTKDRAKLYAQAAKYISDQAYGPNMFAFSGANVVAHGIAGPGLTTQIPPVLVGPTVPWEEVGFTGKP